MNHRLRRQIEKIYKALNNKLIKVYDPNLNYETKENYVKNFNNSDEFLTFKKKNSHLMSNISLSLNKNEWRKKYDELKKQKVISIPYNKFEIKIKKQEYDVFLQFISEIPRKILETNKYKYIKKLQDKVLKNKIGRSSFEKFIKNLGIKNAKTIARTETSRLQAKTVENRARKLSSVAYKWVANHDQRTRESHKNMINVIVFWKDKLENKPHLDKMNGNAGEFPNCRCIAFPIFTERDLPKGALLKVYNFKNGKIEKIKRSEIVQKLKGE